jgi:hypothetical protein
MYQELRSEQGLSRIHETSMKLLASVGVLFPYVKGRFARASTGSACVLC